MAESKSKTKPASAKLDIATLLGLVVAVGAILGGLILEKGQLKDIAQITAAIIVIGGTLGAVMVTTPIAYLMGALKQIKSVLFDQSPSPQSLIEEIIAYSVKARKSGVVTLETDVELIADPFLKKALTLVIDGTDIQDLRKMMELDILLAEHHTESEAKVFEAAGGYAPTVGIIGAVLGLIQVMKHLENIDEVGKGIAVAFVATVYGVGLANIVFIPFASKIKARMRQTSLMKELLLDGVVGIAEGLNPKVIRMRLESYDMHAAGSAKTKGAAQKAPSGAQPASAEG
jgi:chemotaxis protein MotA